MDAEPSLEGISLVVIILAVHESQQPLFLVNIRSGELAFPCAKQEHPNSAAQQCICKVEEECGLTLRTDCLTRVGSRKQKGNHKVHNFMAELPTIFKGILESDNCNSADLMPGPDYEDRDRVVLQWRSNGHKWLTKKGVCQHGLSKYARSSWEVVKRLKWPLAKLRKPSEADSPILGYGTSEEEYSAQKKQLRAARFATSMIQICWLVESTYLHSPTASLLRSLR